MGKTWVKHGKNMENPQKSTKIHKNPWIVRVLCFIFNMNFKVYCILVFSCCCKWFQVFFYYLFSWIDFGINKYILHKYESSSSPSIPFPTFHRCISDPQSYATRINLIRTWRKTHIINIINIKRLFSVFNSFYFINYICYNILLRK